MVLGGAWGGGGGGAERVAILLVPRPLPRVGIRTFKKRKETYCFNLFHIALGKSRESLSGMCFSQPDLGFGKS